MATTILIVDDSLVMCKVIMRMLRDCGIDCTAVEADGGHEALARFTEQPIDLILCDWNMPVMNGLQLVEAIRKLDPSRKVPIIMITTQTSSAKVEQAILAGVQNYLIKPFTPEMLHSKLAVEINIAGLSETHTLVSTRQLRESFIVYPRLGEFARAVAAFGSGSLDFASQVSRKPSRVKSGSTAEISGSLAAIRRA